MAITQVRGFDVSGLLTDKEVRALIGKAPEQHVSNPNLIEIVYCDEIVPEPGDTRRRPLQRMGETEFDYSAQTARIRVFRQKLSGNDDLFDFQDSVFHEVGHVVYYFFLTDRQKERWHSLHRDTEFTWTEAGRDPVEHFAETYANYMLHNELVKRRLPREYSFLKRDVFSVNQERREE